LRSSDGELGVVIRKHLKYYISINIKVIKHHDL